MRLLHRNDLNAVAGRPCHKIIQVLPVGAVDVHPDDRTDGTDCLQMRGSLATRAKQAKDTGILTRNFGHRSARGGANANAAYV